jgi:uncharacterized protein DUF6734
MNAVWSFWSKPFLAHRCSTWLSEKHHLLSWILSVETVKRYYGPAILHTDDRGARMLVDGIGLEFDRVVTSLNALHQHDPAWWALGKLYAYRAQREPFVHLDSDVYLWQPLPDGLISAPVLAQNPEPFMPGYSYYQPEAIDAVLGAGNGGWVPPEWTWYRTSQIGQRGECCGVFGGNRVDFIRHYATQAVRLLEHGANRTAWQRLDRKVDHAILVEQYLLAACIEYHRAHGDSHYRDIDINYLFASMDDAFNPESAERAGYTHLIAGAKRNPAIAHDLESRVAEDYPDQYERCTEYIERRGKCAYGPTGKRGPELIAGAAPEITIQRQ